MTTSQLCGPNGKLRFIMTDDTVCESLGGKPLPDAPHACAIEFEKHENPTVHWKNDGTFRVAVCEQSTQGHVTTSGTAEVLTESIEFYFGGGVNYAGEVEWKTHADGTRFAMMSAKDQTAVPSMLRSILSLHGVSK